MIIVKVGNGEGKTTSAIGLAVRAAGHGKKVLFLQFLKDDSSGEIAVLKSIPQIEVRHPRHNLGFVFQMTDEQKKITAEDCKALISYAMSAGADVIVLDEILHALSSKLITKEELERLLKTDKEMILTGYQAPAWLIDRADYVSEVKKIKHPYDKGVQAIEGIEF